MRRMTLSSQARGLGFVFSVFTIAAMFSLAILKGWAAESMTDEFNGDKFRAKWEWLNEPKKWDLGKTKPGWLHIDADPNRNLWTADITMRLFQTTSEDPFDVETHLATKWAANSVVAGLVVKGPKEDNWVTLKFWGHGDGTAQLQFQTKANENGNGLTGRVPDYSAQKGEAELFMRLAKKGDEYTAYFKLNEKDDWKMVGPTTFKLTPPLQLSLYAGEDAAAGTMTVDYDYFRDLIHPFSVNPQGKLAVVWGTIKSWR